MHNKRLFGTATVGTKGQVVIPASAREELGINTGDRLYVMGDPRRGMLMMLKEDQLEKFIEHINLEVENLKSLKNSQDE
jgi:AbrB family looped-hinge helix DNA binding protein